MIYAVNNTAIRTMEELKTAVESLKSGQPVAIQVERFGQLQFLVFEIEVSERFQIAQSLGSAVDKLDPALRRQRVHRQTRLP